MTIYPTYLYIKQHSITGLKYFGKTTNTDPYKYNGSGKHWKSHIKKHGKEHVVTLWVSEIYIDSDLISNFAITFSKDNNIVESKEWANLIDENGLDGVVKGKTHSDETRAKMAGQTRSDETRTNISIALTGRTQSAEHRAKLSIAGTGRSQSDETRAKQSIANTKLHDVLTPDGFVLDQISTKELCSRFNLNYNTVLSYFKKNKAYKGFLKIR